MLSVWQTDTSLLVSWGRPLVTPTGYVIYYMRINEGVAHQYIEEVDHQSVTVSGDSQSLVLEGLSIEANYSISVLARSRHLPSAIVGSPIMSGKKYVNK